MRQLGLSCHVRKSGHTVTQALISVPRGERDSSSVNLDAIGFGGPAIRRWR
jgi:hypothetical protein